MTSQPTAAPQRRTRQRAAVQDVLAELHEFRTAQQIHDELRQRGRQHRADHRLPHPADALRGRRAGRLCGPSTGETAYRRCSDGHHHHLVCRGCGRTVEVSGPAVERWANAMAAENGFRDVSHDLEIFGTCDRC